MRMTTDEAYNQWKDAEVMYDYDSGDYLSRIAWVQKIQGQSVHTDIAWAFAAGWNAALMNLTTSDI